MSDLHYRAKSIFLEIMEMESSHAREAFLEEACVDNQHLRAEVLELMNHQQQTGDFLELRTDCGVTNLDTPQKDNEPHSIGPYKIREKIGEGGMGVVYVAEQTEPVRRKVALKIVKPGMDSKQVIARFQTERQALAMMDHPNIAQIFDGNTTETGHPYFVMELVQGIPITNYCRQHNLSTTKRLQLFLNVCRAVQHAHQKGVIHRDIKPSNILVGRIDGSAIPKVIDFGVAKAVSDKLTEHTVYTQFSQMIGTPLYMSPEQTELGVVDIDTRSDVYSLGVLLYELLTGDTPFDRARMKSSSYEEIRKIIREEDPPRPSTRVNSHLTTKKGMAKHQDVAVAQRRCKSIRGDLDAIVMKAIEKDRTRRYETANGLVRDIERHLDGEPVEACPPSLAYRFQKFTRRHKGMLTTAGLVLLALLAGTAVSTWYAVDAHLARLLADAQGSRALESSRRTRQLLYAGDMRLAGYAASRNDVARMRELLTPHVPADGEEDLRGFEWHFLSKQTDLRPCELLNSNEALYYVCFSPNDQLLATAGQDERIHLLNSDDWSIVATLDSDQGEVNGLTFSPDSQILASTGDDGSIRLWDIDKRMCVLRIEAHDKQAYQVAFTPDGRILASCGSESVIRFWDVKTGKPLETLVHHKDNVECLAIAGNGLLASGSFDQATVLINLASAKNDETQAFHPANAKWVRGILNWDNGAVTCVDFSDNDGLLGHGQKGGLVTLYDTQGQGVISRQVFPNEIQSIAFSHQNTGRVLSLAVGDRGGDIHLLPVEWAHAAKGMIASHGQSSQLHQWRAHDGRVYSLAFHPNGKQLISAGEDGRLLLWDINAPESRKTLAASYYQPALLGNDRFVTLTRGLPIHDLRDGKVVSMLTSRDQEWLEKHVAYKVDQIVAENSAGEFFAWRSNGSLLGRVWKAPPRYKVGASDLSSDGKRLAVELTDPKGETILEIVDTDLHKSLIRISSGPMKRVAISPNGRFLAFDSLNTIRVLDIITGECVHALSGNRAGISGLEFSPDSRVLASISGNRVLKIWDVTSGSEIWSVIAHENEVTALALAPDGETIATAGNDGLLRLWRWKIGRLVLEFPVNNWPVTHLEFSRDGYRILSSESNCITLYDASTDSQTELASAK